MRDSYDELVDAVTFQISDDLQSRRAHTIVQAHRCTHSLMAIDHRASQPLGTHRGTRAHASKHTRRSKPRARTHARQVVRACRGREDRPGLRRPRQRTLLRTCGRSKSTALERCRVCVPVPRNGTLGYSQYAHRRASARLRDELRKGWRTDEGQKAETETGGVLRARRYYSRRVGCSPGYLRNTAYSEYATPRKWAYAAADSRPTRRAKISSVSAAICAADRTDRPRHCGARVRCRVSGCAPHA